MNVSVNPIFEHLHSMPAEELALEKGADKQTVVSFSPDTSVYEAVKMMAEKRILSAPIVDSERGPIAFVGMLDIASYVYAVAPDAFSMAQNEQRALETSARAMSLVPLSKLLDMGIVKEDSLATLYTADPVTRLVQLFTSGNSHRALLVNKSGDVQQFVSQTDVVRHVQHFIARDKLKTVGDMPIQDLQYGLCTVESVVDSDKVIDAIGKLHKLGVHALAVLDERTGRLVGNFSVSNLRGMYFEHFPSFFKTVRDYLDEQSPESLKPITIKRSATLAEAMNEMVASNLHHLWVIDDDMKPIGVFSMTDVMKIIANFKYDV